MAKAFKAGCLQRPIHKPLAGMVAAAAGGVAGVQLAGNPSHVEKGPCEQAQSRKLAASSVELVALSTAFAERKY